MIDINTKILIENNLIISFSVDMKIANSKLATIASRFDSSTSSVTK